jgi:hypothetical protein
MVDVQFDTPGVSVKLGAIPTDPPKRTGRQIAEAEFTELGKELFELQDLLWGAPQRARGASGP